MGLGVGFGVVTGLEVLPPLLPVEGLLEELLPLLPVEGLLEELPPLLPVEGLLEELPPLLPVDGLLEELPPLLPVEGLLEELPPLLPVDGLLDELPPLLPVEGLVEELLSPLPDTLLVGSASLSGFSDSFTSEDGLPSASTTPTLEEGSGASAVFPEPHAESNMARTNPTAATVVFFIDLSPLIFFSLWQNYTHHTQPGQLHLSC